MICWCCILFVCSVFNLFIRLLKGSYGPHKALEGPLRASQGSFNAFFTVCVGGVVLFVLFHFSVVYKALKGLIRALWAL